MRNMSKLTGTKMKNRTVSFDSDVNIMEVAMDADNAAKGTYGQNEPELQPMQDGGLIDGLELQKDDMKNMDSRTKTFAKRTMVKLMKECKQNKALVIKHNAKVEELENDLDQQVIRTKIAQESEMAIRERYTKAKKGYLELSDNEQVSGKLANRQKSITLKVRMKDS